MSIDHLGLDTRHAAGGRSTAPPAAPPVVRRAAAAGAIESVLRLWAPVLAKALFAAVLLAALASIGWRAAHVSVTSPATTQVVGAGMVVPAVASRLLDGPTVTAERRASAAESTLPIAVPPATPVASSAPASSAAPGSSGEAPADPPSRPARLLPGERIALNVATADDLMRLRGIGRVRANAILALRARLGRFRAIEDLLRVKGLGRKTLQRLRPYIVLDPPPPSSGPDAGLAPSH